MTVCERKTGFPTDPEKEEPNGEGTDLFAGSFMLFLMTVYIICSIRVNIFCSDEAVII